MKRFVIVLSILLVGISILSLGTLASGRPFRIAVIFPGSINDHEWDQSLYDSLVSIQNDMGKDNLQFVYSENMYVMSDATVAIRDYASKGYDLVITYGDEYAASLLDIAPDFPHTSFACAIMSDIFSPKGVTNVFPFLAHGEQAGYVLGTLAGLLSKTGVIGVILPIKGADMWPYVQGVKAGVLAQNPTGEVKVVWTGSYSDAALASQAAQTLISAGADVLTGMSQAAFGALNIAHQHGALWLGMRYDQIKIDPEVVVADVVYDWTPLLNSMIKSIKAGKLGGPLTLLSFSNGGLKLRINSDLMAKVLTAKTVKGINDGTIEINIEK